jgi:hypothetical protein
MVQRRTAVGRCRQLAPLLQGQQREECFLGGLVHFGDLDWEIGELDEFLMRAKSQPKIECSILGVQQTSARRRLILEKCQQPTIRKNKLM